MEIDPLSQEHLKRRERFLNNFVTTHGYETLEAMLQEWGLVACDCLAPNCPGIRIYRRPNADLVIQNK